MSGYENGADPSYVGNDNVNTFYGDVIVAYPVPVVGNGIVICLCPYGVELSPGHTYDKPIYFAVDPKVGSQQFKPLQMGEIDKCRRSLVAPSLVTTV